MTDLSYDTDAHLCSSASTYDQIWIQWGDGKETIADIWLEPQYLTNAKFNRTCTSASTFTVRHAVQDNVGSGWVYSTDKQITVP